MLRQGKKRPASLISGTGFEANALNAYTLCQDNGGIFRHRLLNLSSFTLQLRGPFGAFVHAGSHLFLLSVQPFQRVLVLFIVFWINFAVL